MHNKTSHSISLGSNQWKYTTDLLIKPRPSTIQTQILSYHQHKKKEKIRLFNTIHQIHLNEKRSKLDILRSRNRFFITNQNTLPAQFNTFSAHNQKTKEKQSKNDPLFIYTFDPLLYSSISVINSKESCIQFTNKTKAMVKAKQIQFYQNEKLKQVKEGLKSQFQGLTTQIYNLNKDRMLLLYFGEIQIKYLSFLYNTLEEEKRKLAFLKEQRYDLDHSINQLNAKLIKENQLLQNSKQYKIFLLLVKFKVRSMDQIPVSELKYYGITQSISRESFFKRNSIRIMKRSSILRELRAPFSFGINLNDNSNTQNIPKKNRRISQLFKDTGSTSIADMEPEHKNPSIFASPDEFIDYFKKLEDRTVHLFTTFNQMTYDSKALLKERDNSKNQIEDEILIEFLAHEFTTIKERHNYLINEYKRTKQRLDNCPSVESLFEKIKVTLLNIPLQIDILIDLPMFYSYMYEPSNVIFISGKKENKVVYSIKALEKTLVFLLTKLNEYKTNIQYSNKLRKVTFSLEKLKRYEKSKQIQLMQKEKRKIKEQNFSEKYHKVLFLPKRKTYTKYQGKNSRNIVLKTRNNTEDYYLEAEAFLTY